MSKVYRGKRPPGAAGPAVVQVDGRPLALRIDLRNHSPDGFQWGYNGSGPAQLALALLADALGCDVPAVLLYQEFKEEVVARMRDDEWELARSTIAAWARAELREERENCTTSEWHEDLSSLGSMLRDAINDLHGKLWLDTDAKDFRGLAFELHERLGLMLSKQDAWESEGLRDETA